MNTNRNQVASTLLAIAMILMAGIALLILVIAQDKNRSKTTTPQEVKEVVGKTWTWAKLVTTPVRVVIPTDGPQAVDLSQVEFQVSDTETKPAFVDTGKLFPVGGYHVGDEVLIAEVPGKNVGAINGYQPVVTYFVVDYRQAGSTNSARKVLQ